MKRSRFEYGLNLLGLLISALGVFGNVLNGVDNLLTSLLNLVRDAVTLLRLLPKENTGDLGCADAEEEEVDGSEAVACVSFNLVACVCTD